MVYIVCKPYVCTCMCVCTCQPLGVLGVVLERACAKRVICGAGDRERWLIRTMSERLSKAEILQKYRHFVLQEMK